MKFRRQSSDNVEINLAPLIDVVFLLLIFFMVTTTFTRETRIGVVLPEASGQPRAEVADYVEVVIGAGGEYLVNGEQLLRQDEATLRSVLLPMARAGTDRPLVITADASSPHQAVVRVMDVAGQLGFVNITITTQAPSGG